MTVRRGGRFLGMHAGRTARVSRALLLSAACLALVGAAAPTRAATVTTAPRDEPRTIRAAFVERSYVVGRTATLTVRADAPTVSVRMFHAGPEGTRPRRSDVMGGVPITGVRIIHVNGGRATVRIRIGVWQSGFYFARLKARGGYLGFAPVIVRPRLPGRSRVAVIVPTNTWQAYNFRDVDGNGVGDTWYADSHIPCVDLQRPYLDRGVPSVRFRGFLRWFEHGGRHADFLSDEDLDRTKSGDTLAHRYDFVLFASHEEYVTTHVYDIVKRFRDLGGNLAFLAANTFFYRVEPHGHRICRTGLWKDLGRIDAALTGVHYLGWWEHRYPTMPYVARAVSRAPWFYKGSGVKSGDTLGGRYGIEIDKVTQASPPGTIVLAEIEDQFGPRRGATMAYYEMARGAKVFAAGAMGFESPQTPLHKRLLDNLWDHLVER